MKHHEQWNSSGPSGSQGQSQGKGGRSNHGGQPPSTSSGFANGPNVSGGSQPGQPMYYGGGGGGMLPGAMGGLRQDGARGALPHGQVHGYLPPHGYHAQGVLRANSQTVLGPSSQPGGPGGLHHQHMQVPGGPAQYVNPMHPPPGHAGHMGQGISAMGMQMGAMHAPMGGLQMGAGMPAMQMGMQMGAVAGQAIKPGDSGAATASGGRGAKKDSKKVKKEADQGRGLLGDSSLKKPSTESFQLKKKKKGGAGGGHSHGGTNVGSGGASGKGSAPESGGKGGKGSAPESGGKGGKGLRHFSMKVCAKVESKGRTTYNEVADELVAELSAGPENGSPDVAYDEKNIRRRVYDALNVLMAMDIISKEKKEISWKGLPITRENNFDLLKEDQKRVNMQIEKKRLYLKELVDQKKAIEALIERNKAKPKGQGQGQGQGQGEAQGGSDQNQCTGVQLPFLVVQTKPDAKVDVQISEDRQFVSFDFTYNPFEIHDENYVLMNMVKNKTLGSKST